MTRDWVKDIHDMHAHYGFDEAVREFDAEKLGQMLDFRISFLEEELIELKTGVRERSAEDVVDALIDLCVVAIGTLDVFNVDAHGAWDQVHSANMQKRVGVKESRPNPLGLPDLVKPEGWTAPWHGDNHGLLAAAMRRSRV